MFFYILLNYSHLQMLYKIQEDKKESVLKENRLFFVIFNL